MQVLVYGALDVQLTDAFFNDPKSYEGKYVIPVVMKSQTGVDRILAGEYNPGITSGSRFDGDAWFVAPKDYVLYCVRYISKYEGYYLPKGTVTTVYNGANSTKTYPDVAWEYISNDDALFFDTKGVNTVVLPVDFLENLDSFLFGFLSKLIRHSVCHSTCSS